MEKFIQNIVVIHNNKPRASSLLIAQGFNRKHQVVLGLITKYKSDIEEFGKLPLEKVKSFQKIISLSESDNSKTQETKGRRAVGRPTVAYLLNEEQTIFLATLFANTKIVIAFKKRLVKDFYRQKRLLRQVAINRKSPEWVQERIESKERRLEETGAIKEFVAYAKNQGSKNAGWYYTIFTNMQNQALFILDGKFKNLRDVMTPSQLMTIGVADRIVKKTIEEGMKGEVYYKDIFRKAKENMILFAQLHGQEKIIAEMKRLEAPKQKQLKQ